MKTLLILISLFIVKSSNDISALNNDDGRTIMIPVIFHIITSNEKMFITAEQIAKEIENLNIDYSASNKISNAHPDYKSLLGNPNLKFYAAKIENVTTSNGIIRYKANTKHKNHKIQDPSKYLNICVGDFGSVTQMSAPNNHKVHVNFRNIGDGGHSVTHELGHYFGLWHVWGKSNCKNIKIGTSRTDDIADTPTQTNCTDKSRNKTCPEILTKRNFNANNFMDYSSCRMMLTKGQAKEMRKNIINHRFNMYANSL